MDGQNFFIGGKWLKPSQPSYYSITNPSTGAIIGTVPLAGAGDINRAVAAAKRGLENPEWSELSAAGRSELLRKLADEVERIATDLASTITMEAGIPIAFTRDLHVLLPLQFPRYYSDLLDSFEFERQVRSGDDAIGIIRVIPAGVAALIIPWNIPITGILAKLSPALAAGCTAVIKPSPETPLSAYLFAAAVERAGIPPGVVNIVLTDLEGSKHLCSHPDVSHVSFTGSTNAGREIATTCASVFKRSTLELGGNAASIVLDDASIETTAQNLALQSIVMNNGQACVMQRRILVPRHQISAWTEALVAVVSSLTVGDASDPATMIGPMISAAHQKRVTNYIKMGFEEGAKLATNPVATFPQNNGFFVAPAIFTDVKNSMRIAQDEIFGPVACIIPYDNEVEALEIANDTSYGLSGSVWSSDTTRAKQIGKEIKAGTIWLNGTLRLDPQVPFGGMGASGWGRELGPEGLLAFCETQSLFMPFV